MCLTRDHIVKGGSGERDTGLVYARTEKHLNCTERDGYRVIYATRSDVVATAGWLPSSGFCIPHPRSSTVQGVSRILRNEVIHS